VSFDPKPYAEGIRAENEAERRRTEERYGAAIVEAGRIARAIAGKDPAVERVILFGSLADGVPRNPAFDIDLALDGGDSYRAMDEADGSDFHVDIVDLRLVPPGMRQRILERGIVMAERL
jgi:hypothetical protein